VPVGPAYITNITPTSITFIIPDGITCSGSVKKSLNVTVNGVSSVNPVDLIVNVPLPSVSISTPVENAQVCPQINVSGTFTDNSGCGIDYIMVNGGYADISGNGYTKNIEFASIGTKTIVVEIKDRAGGVVTTTRNVNVVEASISSITPLYGPPGTEVTINGNCFSQNKSDYKITLTGYTRVPWNNRAIIKCNYSTSPPCLTDSLVITSASSNSVSFTIPQDIVGADNSVSINIKEFSAGSINFFVDPLLSGIGLPCPGQIYSTGGIYSIEGGGINYDSKVQIYDPFSGAWYDYKPPQYNNAQIFIDNDGSQDDKDPCKQLVGDYGNIRNLPAPTIYFTSCSANPPVTIKLRINNYHTRPDGTLSISGEYYLTVNYACGL